MEPDRHIANLVGCYAERLDAGDLAGVAALFARAEYGLAGGDAVRGAGAVETLLSSQVQIHENGTPRTRHLTTNLIIEVEDGAAGRARSTYTVLQYGPDRPLAPIVMGRYEDDFRCDAEGWHFVSRRIHIDWVGDLGDHLKRPISVSGT